MGILDTLVVGVDGSEASRIALSWAAARVNPVGTLHLATVSTGEEPDHGATDSREVDGCLGEGWSRVLDGCDARIETHQVNGEPAEELLRIADETGANAIIVGPHSKPGNIVSLGQVTRRLLQRAAIPIVVARGSDPGRPPEGETRPIMACVGYGDATERAALWAADYASARAQQLTLLHVVGYRPLFPADSPSDMLASYFGGDVLREWARDDLDEIRTRIEARNADLETEIAVEVGFASREILAAGDEAELVVLGKRQDGAALRNFISPRIHHLIVKSTASVAVIPSCFTST